MIRLALIKALYRIVRAFRMCDRHIFVEVNGRIVTFRETEVQGVYVKVE